MNRIPFSLAQLPVVLLVFGFVFLSASSGKAESYSILFSSKRGGILATGEIALADKLPTSGTVRGSYRLTLKRAPRTDKEVDWFFRLFEGKLVGHVHWILPESTAAEGLSNFNFMPETADANVFASAKLDADGTGQGTWSYAIFAGAWGGGAFEIKKQ